MDCIKVGQLIHNLRKEKGMTQKQLAYALNISDKAISKWECGNGCPDVSLLSELSAVLGVNIEKILSGELLLNETVGGNMKNIKFYVCKTCGNISMCTGNAEVSCCGRKLEALSMKKAAENQRLHIEEIENDRYITSDSPMKKDDYISFAAFATGNVLNIIKQYPEWSFEARIPVRGHGILIWYSDKEGLLYQPV